MDFGRFLILFIVLYLVTITVATSTNNNNNETATSIDAVVTPSFDNLTDIDAILEQNLGPRRKSLAFTVSMSITYILIFLCGLIGNICVCCVIICNNCMHTTTNYYLFSLAVSDVLSVLFGLPPEIYSLIIAAYPWAFGNTFCTIRTFVFEATTIATALTILAFTFERWLHICKPIYAQRFSNSFSRALKIIIFIWFVSSVLAAPYSVITGSENFIQNIPESKLCKPLDQYQNLMTTMLLLSTILLFIVPMTLISIMYVLIGLTLWRSHTRKKNYPSTELTKSECFRICNNKEKRQQKLKQSTSTPQYLFNEQNNLLDSSNSFRTVGGNTTRLKHSYSTKNASESLKVNGDGKNVMDLNLSEFSLYDTTTTANTNSVNNNSSNQHERRSRELEYISYRTKQSRRDVIKMLFVVVICFFLCWAPHHIQRIMTYIVQRSTQNNMKIHNFMMNLLEFLYYTSGVLVYISSTINPILYNVMSKRYRTAFKNTLTMICTCSCSTKALASRRSTYYYNRYSSRNVNNNHNNNNNNNSVYRNNTLKN